MRFIHSNFTTYKDDINFMHNKWKALAGFTLAVFVPLGFWWYFFAYKGLPKPIKKWFPTGEVKHYKFRGEDKVDSVYHTIAPFVLTNQLGQPFSTDSLKDRIYIANFFFCSCPTICPVMTKQLLRVQQKYKDVKWLKILSFTVDPEHDSIAALNKYAQHFGILANQWQLLTGNRDTLYNLCSKSFYLAVQADGPEAFDHSNKLVLVDNHSIIRGYYDGTDSTAVDKLIKDSEAVLKELSNDVYELRPPRN